MSAWTLRSLACAVAAVVLAGIAPGAPAEDLEAVRVEVERTLPQQMLGSIVVPRELTVRSVPTLKPASIYARHVDGVVLLASTKTIATGVLISKEGDIITNDHIVEHAQVVGGERWIAVWFRPPGPLSQRAGLGSFLLARVVQREPLRDLARLRLAQDVPDTATVIDLPDPGTARPVLPGGKVVTIGHPGSMGWRLAEGTVSSIRPNYQWTYADGVPRNATAIEMSTPITTGNSGGPLFDEKGAMVGIVAGSAVQQGAGFAVAVQHVHDLMKVAARRSP